MKQFLIVLLFALTTVSALAQTPQNTAKNSSPSAVIAEEKPAKTKSVILDKLKLQELNILRLTLENAQLKAEAAIPTELKADVKKANDAIAEFWKAAGINPAELSTKWSANNGQNGDIILTRNEEPVLKAAPTAEAKKN